MAGLRFTLGSVMNTVTDTANAASTTINVAVKGIGMLDTFVTDLAKQQQVRSVINMANFEQQIIEDTAMEMTQRQEKIAEYINKDVGTKEAYESNHQKLSALLKKD